jgi:hypothetical protein
MAKNPATFKMTEIPNSEIKKLLDEIQQENKFDVIAKEQNATDKTWTLTVRRKTA